MGGPVEEELRRLRTLVAGCTSALTELDRFEEPEIEELRRTIERTRANAIGRLAMLGGEIPPEQAGPERGPGESECGPRLSTRPHESSSRTPAAETRSPNRGIAAGASR